MGNRAVVGNVTQIHPPARHRAWPINPLFHLLSEMTYEARTSLRMFHPIRAGTKRNWN